MNDDSRADFAKGPAQPLRRYMTNGEKNMTTPYERTRALIETKHFLEQLLVPKESPRVPAWARERARKLLRHYPMYSNIELAHKALPEFYGPVPPFSRLRGSAETDHVIEASRQGRTEE